MKRLSCAVIVLMSGCALPATHLAKVPDVVVPNTWRTETGVGGPIARDWWKSFGDPGLDELVARALANNSDIGSAVGRVRAARAQEQLSLAQLRPSIDAGLPAARTRSVSAFGRASEQTVLQPQLTTSYEVDLFGRLADSKAATRATLLASEAARDTVQLSVAAAAASGYVTLSALNARLVVARRTLAIREQAVRIAQSRSKAGYAPLLELRQSEAELSATALIVPQVELAITRQQDALAELAGLPAGALPTPTPLDALSVPPVPAGLPSDLLRRRPDIAQAELQLAASRADLSAARKRFLPQLRLSGTAGDAISTLLANPIGIWSAGGSILAPLFEGGRLRAGLEGASAQQDIAAFNYRRVVLGAFREVDDLLATIARQREQLQLLERQREALAQAYHLATRRYAEGYSSHLEQLDAERGLLATDLSVVQARADESTATIALFRALGGGWSARYELPSTR